MALVTTTEMFKKAYDGGYAIGAFNVNNMEIVQAITEACKEENAPVILQVSKGARAYANHTYRYGNFSFWSKAPNTHFATGLVVHLIYNILVHFKAKRQILY